MDEAARIRKEDPSLMARLQGQKNLRQKAQRRINEDPIHKEQHIEQKSIMER